MKWCIHQPALFDMEDQTLTIVKRTGILTLPARDVVHCEWAGGRWIKNVIPSLPNSLFRVDLLNMLQYAAIFVIIIIVCLLGRWQVECEETIVNLVFFMTNFTLFFLFDSSRPNTFTSTSCMKSPYFSIACLVQIIPYFSFYQKMHSVTVYNI